MFIAFTYCFHWNMLFNKNILFFKQIVSVMKSGYFFKNIESKKYRGWGGNGVNDSLIVPKAGLHPKNVMSCIW